MFKNLMADWEAKVYFKHQTVMELIDEMRSFFDGFMIPVCETLATDKNLLDKLKSEQFDLAVGHNYDLCSFGLIHTLGISTYVWASSGLFMDHIAWTIGSPSPASYVPNMLTSYSDKMSFTERLKNFLGTALLHIMHYDIVVKPEQKVFYNHYGQDFPSLSQLAAKSSLVFINSEQFVDFPKPILHKVLYIGGIEMSKPAPLENKWQKIADDSDQGFVIVSFGSNVNASAMPMLWKVIIFLYLQYAYANSNIRFIV